MKEYLGDALTKIINELSNSFEGDIKAQKEALQEQFDGIKTTMEKLWKEMSEGLDGGVDQDGKKTVGIMNMGQIVDSMKTKIEGWEEQADEAVIKIYEIIAK